jgi:hypothetical protein
MNIRDAEALVRQELGEDYGVVKLGRNWYILNSSFSPERKQQLTAFASPSLQKVINAVRAAGI